MDEQALIDRAERAYARRVGPHRMLPSRGGCRVKRRKGVHYVVLANGCGAPEDTLAVYRVPGDPRRDFRLVGLTSWPKAVTS